MRKSQLQVKEFHEKFGLPIHLIPQCAIPKVRAELRANLIIEEAIEAIHAMGCTLKIENERFVCKARDDRSFDLAKVVDALFDLEYVCDGAALEFGVDMDPAWDEGHDSNMSKMWTAKDINSSSLGVVDTRHVGDGQYVVRRADGKIFKSPSYRPADFQKVIDKQLEDSRK